ncbi:hypothetical protein C496_23221 [Natronorubrum tibetense GA33]|uniref:Uncharacterized protein n=1 Tax=Natronorubrum tibetense GA33 TaxID=1114856 RepID=L9VER1_9EURY|nr:hypothetical protein C496_23221 [Natronorubrum tibetense GA33]
MLADEILVYLDRPSIRGDDSFSAAVTLRIDRTLLSRVYDSTREITLAVVELCHEFRDRVASFEVLTTSSSMRRSTS